MRIWVSVIAMIISQLSVAKPIAYLVQSGGYCLGGCPTITVVLEDNGLTRIEAQYYHPQERTEKAPIFLVNPKVIQTFRKSIQDLKERQLIDLNPEGPACADRPSEVYVVVKGSEKIDIAQDVNCKEYRLQNNPFQSLMQTLRLAKDLYFRIRIGG